MKLKNKKTGEIVRVEFLNNWQTDDGTEIGFRECNTNIVYSYTSLAELNEEWEDYEEPKKHYSITQFGDVVDEADGYMSETIDEMKQIGNYFNTREEAERAVEKLKAWKRLKEANIDYKLTHEYDDFTETMNANVSFSFNSYPLVGKDLELLLGGK